MRCQVPALTFVCSLGYDFEPTSTLEYEYAHQIGIVFSQQSFGKAIKPQLLLLPHQPHPELNVKLNFTKGLTRARRKRTS